MLIRVDGEITPCMYNYDVAIKNYFEIGKLNDKIPLIEAYNNIALQKLREDQNNGIFHGPCKTCNSAYTGYGFRGELTLNRDIYKVGKLYHGKDYYNEMYSQIDKKIGIQHERIQ
jgi:radical SAM protein with 4Fe4S-binding SPASM domain